MKKAIAYGISALVCPAITALSAVSPLYVIDAPVDCTNQPPQIDATAVLNRSTFCYSSLTFPGLPFETFNTLFFTNTASGRMQGSPGFRFNYARDNTRHLMDTWVNRGTISAANDIFFLSGANANWLLVSATNIHNSGFLNVGSQGLLRLEGEHVDLSRSGLRAANAITNNGFFFGTSVLSSNYVNDVGISDIYWGTGTNNAMDDMGSLMTFSSVGFGNALNGQLPTPSSPLHDVVQRFLGGVFTNTAVVPGFNSINNTNNYAAYVRTNQIGPTNFTVQVVFSPTNNPMDTNLSTTVQFLPGFGTGGGSLAVVGFHSVEFDIVELAFRTNSVFLVDALAFRTNTFFGRNTATGTRRPGNYDVTRNPISSFFGSQPANATYNSSILFRPTMLSNQVSTFYSGYQANISPINTPGFTVLGSLLSDPTNYPGRIEIVGDEVNLDRTRARAESTILIRANNLVNNQFAQVDAPFMVFDVGSTQPSLVVSNIAPETVGRLSGTISAWSAVWKNYEIDTVSSNLNEIDFHVLIVDPMMRGDQPVIMNEFGLRATNIVIADSITVGSTFKIEADGLDLANNFNLPQGASWAATNVLNVLNFTNRGVLSMSGTGLFGSDRDNPYEPYHHFVNLGTISGASLFVDSTNFVNRGHIRANGGLVDINTQSAAMIGPPNLVVTNFSTNFLFLPPLVIPTLVTNSFGPLVSADSDIVLSASDLVLSNATLIAGTLAPGAAILNVTNRMWAPIGNGTNVLRVRAGFQLQTAPIESDLFGLEVVSEVPSFALSEHVWAADDLGSIPAGFTNNMALGKLTLDVGSSLSEVEFRGLAPGQALYVDYLELRNFATNYLGPESVFTLRPGYTVYFANANVDAGKLDEAPGFTWVSNFAGPRSSTNVFYPSSGTTNTFNVALVRSRDIDSDGDGVPNFFDEEPIPVPGDIALSVTMVNKPDPRNVISWNGLAFATNTVYYTESLAQESSWTVLTQMVTGPFNRRLQVVDPIPPSGGSGGQRFYRVMIEPRR